GPCGPPAVPRPGRPMISVSDFIEGLRDYGLLRPDQLREVIETLGPRFAVLRPLAGELIRLGWLTPYQVNQLATGQTHNLVIGSYVLLERLGKGGMGQVFKARHRHMNRLVALKLIRSDRLGGAGSLRRFQREIEAAAQLSHPNIVHA